MFGWLASRSTLCPHATATAVSRRARRITPHLLLDLLPALGSVLYLHATANEALPDDLPQGVLVQRACVPLLGVCWLVAVSAVTGDGPREWCECVDARGRTRARWHLLPDTDYLAWDALTACCTEQVSPLMDAHPLLPDSAKVVNFHLREFAGLLLLEQAAAPALSPLGEHIAKHIANAEYAHRWA